MPDKVNASWFRMATEYGVFNDDHEFLVWVDDAEIHGAAEIETRGAWALVQLLGEWNWAAGEIEQFRSWIASTFTTRFVPEFTVASLSGQTTMNTTVWGNGTVSTIAICPSARSAQTGP